MSDRNGRVVVVGSVNLDRRVLVERLPLAGETVAARSASTGPGGKGLNQAVAAARAGARVELIGCVGDDDAGRELRALAGRERIDVGGLRVSADQPTGQAMVWVDDAGANSIVVVGGANATMDEWSQEVVEAIDALDLETSDLVLAQGETSLAVTARVFAAARDRGARTILNLAPYRPPTAALLAATAVLVVNETEFAALAGWRGSAASVAPVAAARVVLGRGPEVVVITLGPRGAVAVSADEHHAVDALSVDVVDTTGAGDGFVGALAAELARGVALGEALAFANAAAALVVQRPGAATAMPTRSEVDLTISGLRPLI